MDEMLEKDRLKGDFRHALLNVGENQEKFGESTVLGMSRVFGQHEQSVLAVFIDDETMLQFSVHR